MVTSRPRPPVIERQALGEGVDDSHRFDEPLGVLVEL
jgi:hypothetical protein